MPKYMLIALEPAQIRLEGDESIKKKEKEKCSLLIKENQA